MTAKKLTKQSMDDWVDALVGSETVYGPQQKGEKFDFMELRSARDLRLDYDVSLLPPKKYVLPVDEALMTYEVGGTYSSAVDNKSFVLLGIHPYDMVAINQMDVLFTQDNYDTHYMQRRKNMTVVVCDVINASENVFASSMKTALVHEGYDVLITAVDDGYVVEAATDKGKLLLAKASGATEATGADLDKRTRVQEANRIGLNKHKLQCDPHSLPRLLEKAYHHDIWKEKAKTCFACGSCNLVCPTCYCFDVQDDVQWDMKHGQRTRCWDGCLLNGFAKVAGDHDFRANRADRFRHRLYRKAKYVPAKIGGDIACVGCGRCVGACLPDIANPVTVYNQLLDEIGLR